MQAKACWSVGIAAGMGLIAWRGTPPLIGLAAAYPLGEMLLGLIITDRVHSTLKADLNWQVLAFNLSVALAAGLLAVTPL